MRIYSVDRLFEEVAFVAYHFHWGHEEVLNMPHWERQRWCEEINKINDRLNRAVTEAEGSRTTHPGIDREDRWI